MRQLLDWTLETIRSENSDFSWMEEFRFEWTPLVKSVVSRLIDGQTMLVMSDNKRRWFKNYVLSRINDTTRDRPFFPVFDMKGIYPNIDTLNRTEDMDILNDMLSISFPEGYFIWYIGDGDHSSSKFAFSRDDSYLWLIDKELPESFILSGSDPLLDIKLIQLYKLLDKTIEAILFGEVDIYS